MSGGHYLTLTLDSEWLDFKVECREPEGSMCRVTCPDGCESYGEDHEHELVPVDHCNAVEWINAFGVQAESHIGEDVLVKAVPIEVDWNGEMYEWYLKQQGSGDPS